MKISSNFHDYYDVMRTGDQDPDPLYVRITKEIEQRKKKHYSDRLTPEEDANNKHVTMLNKYWLHLSVDNPKYTYLKNLGNSYNSNYRPNWLHQGVIGVCGRVYPVIGVGYFSKKNVKFAYNPDKAIKLVSEFSDPEPSLREFIKGDKERVIRAMNRETKWRAPNTFYFEDWSKLLEDNQIGDEIFRHFKAPVLLTGMIENDANNRLICINPRLGKYEFAQAMNPPEIYQELSMFVGNNLANLDRKEPRPITDVLKAETKGFDKKSFRNQKNRKVFDRKDW